MSQSVSHSRTPRCFGVIVFFLLLVLFSIGAAFLLINQAEKKYGHADPMLSKFKQAYYGVQLLIGQEKLNVVPSIMEEIKFEVDPQDQVKGICRRLANIAGVNAGQETCAYLVFAGLDRQVMPGMYTLQTNVTLLDWIRRISLPENRDIQFNIYPGWRQEEVVSAIQSAGFHATEEELMRALKQPELSLIVKNRFPEAANLEGFFCPDTYSIKPETTLNELVSGITSCWADRPDLIIATSKYKGLAITNYDLLILASIIQRETNAIEEMPLIASVFYNRLAVQMPLQTDPTVQYGIGFDVDSNSWWKPGLTYEDLEINSPYNTYVIPSLPPAPISSPSLDALMAVIHPEESDYLFFRAKCDGSGTHTFAITFDEHLNNACP